MKKIIKLYLYLFSSFLLAQNKLNFTDNNYYEATQKAKMENKLIFVDFYTTWCAPCKRMDKEVFTDSAITSFFNNNFINLKIDAESKLGLKISPKYKVEAFPTFVFIDPKEKMVYKLEGYISKYELLKKAKEAINEFKKGESIEVWDQKYLSNKKNKVFLRDYITKLNSLKRKIDEPFSNYYALLSERELVEKQNVSFFINNPYLHKDFDKFKFLISKYHDINKAISSNYFPGSFHDSLYESLLNYFNEIVETKNESQLNKFQELLTIFPLEQAEKPWFRLNNFSHWKAKYYLKTNDIVNYLRTTKLYSKYLLNTNVKELKVLDSINLSKTNLCIQVSTYFKSQENKNQVIKMNNEFLKNHLSENLYSELIEIAKYIIYYDENKDQIIHAINLLNKAREVKVLAFGYYLEAIGEYKLNNTPKAKQFLLKAKKKAGEPNLLKLIDETTEIINKKLPFQNIQKI